MPDDKLLDSDACENGHDFIVFPWVAGDVSLAGQAREYTASTHRDWSAQCFDEPSPAAAASTGAKQRRVAVDGDETAV